MEILQKFEYYSKFHFSKFLSNIDKNRLFEKSYMEKVFFLNYAYERANGPKGFKVISVKILEDLKFDKNLNLKETFINYYYSNKDKLNVNHNPILDDKIKSFDINSIIKNISNGSLEEAFNQLELKGIGHKIRSLFIRDILFLLDKEKMILKNLEKSIYTFPIDFWVRKTLNCLIKPNKSYKDIKRSNYGNLTKSDFMLAAETIEQCFQYNISPICANMGIWFFASNIVADEKRLGELLHKGPEEMENEMAKFYDIL